MPNTFRDCRNIVLFWAFFVVAGEVRPINRSTATAADPPVAHSATNEEVDAIESQFLRSRDPLKSSTVSMRCVSSIMKSVPDYEQMERRYIIYSHDSAFRFDYERRVPKHTIKDYTIYNDTHFYDATGGPPAGPFPLVQVSKRARQQPENKNQFHPRQLGTFPASTLTLGNGEAHSLYGRSDRTDIQITETERDGQPVRRVEFNIGRSHITMDYTMQNDAISYIETWVRDDDPNREYKRQLTVTNDKWPPSGLVYPKEIKFIEMKAGEVLEEETAIVESVEYASPPNPDVFTLGGLGLPDGRKVIVDGLRIMETKGGKLVPEQVSNPAPVVKETSPDRRFVIVVVNAAVLFCIGAYLLFRKRDAKPAG